MDYNLSSVRDERWRVHVESSLFILLLGIIFLIRIADTNYNTVFYDEAVNATLGREVLNRDFAQNATSWTFGSYLYPFLAAVADRFGGLTGLRVLSAAFSTITACFVFLTTLWLFDTRSALLAMLIFGLTGASISLGQLAVYDTPAVPLLSIALFCLVASALESKKKTELYLLAAGYFSLSVLSKYIGLLFLPALVLVAVILYIALGRSVRPLLTVFLGTTFIILASYFLLNQEALTSMLTHSSTLLSVPSERVFILKTIWDETGVVIPVAIVGVLLLPRVPFVRAARQSRRTALLMTALLPCLLLAIFAAPIYQVITQNIQSLWKHLVFSLVFLSPLAGYALSTFIAKVRSYSGPRAIYYQTVGAALTLISLMWFVNYAQDRVWGLQHSWPNSTGAVEYLRTHESITMHTRVLAEQSAVYEYYLSPGPGDRDVWSNTFYMEYRLRQGLDAMTYAIEDRYFDWVILDDYYTPEKNRVLEDTLAKAGYVLSYKDPEPQVLSTDQTTTTRIYKKRGN